MHCIREKTFQNRAAFNKPLGSCLALIGLGLLLQAFEIIRALANFFLRLRDLAVDLLNRFLFCHRLTPFLKFCRSLFFTFSQKAGLQI